MNKSYYKVPIDFDGYFNKQELSKSSIKESISNFLHVILTTYLGECDFDDNFGSKIWDLDFNNIESTTKFRAQVADELEETVANYEKRLDNVRVDVMIKQTDIFEKSVGRHNIKKQVDVTIRGVVKKTNEGFAYIENFFIAPLSY